MHSTKTKFIARDISWLSFNARVLQEAADKTVSLSERMKFLGIFSNNLDEFFRVRVAALKRMSQLKYKTKMHVEENPEKILDEIQLIVLKQQSEFDRIWQEVTRQLRNQKIYIKQENELTINQKIFINNYFENEVSSNIIPLMIENIPVFPTLRDKSIYLGVVMWNEKKTVSKKYALIEVPTRAISRFTILPSEHPTQHHLILLEDIIRANLPHIFSYFGYNKFKANLFKVTRDAELDIDNDLSTTIVEKITKGLINRKKGKPVRFVFDREMDSGLLEYLIKRMGISKKDNIIPGGRIHNFRHFIDFPSVVFQNKTIRKKPFDHPNLIEGRVTDIIQERDVMLHFPYHSFKPVIDLLREAAIDPMVTAIKITCYRLAQHSKIVNALINSLRNGKVVTVMLELRARFEEEANLEWLSRLKEEGAIVLEEIADMKVHAKICSIQKKNKNGQFIYYGFISTGNFNEHSAKIYADHCLITANRKILDDINRIFYFLEKRKNGYNYLKDCRYLLPSPTFQKKYLLHLIDVEIKNKQHHKLSGITIKLNSLSDEDMIEKLHQAARVGVPINLIIRGICCMFTQNEKYPVPINAISIIDEYLEHTRMFLFVNNGKEKMYISSADWMRRNLDHRIEAATPIFNKNIITEIKEMIHIQLQDNVKARKLDNEQQNEYVKNNNRRIRSQIAIYNYLFNKTKQHEIRGN